MWSSFPKQFKFSLLTGAVFILLLLLLPSIAALDGEHGSDWAIFFGRFHIVVLHLPIGWLMLLPIVEFIAYKTKSSELKSAIRIILYVASASAILVVIVGLTLASSEGYFGSLVTTHMWLGITTAVFTILACLFNEGHNLYQKSSLRTGYATSLLVALVAVSWGGHLGGSLVQGEGYLTEKLPTELKINLGLEEPEVLLSYESPVYDSFIAPIFEQKCQSCHNEGKVKGQFLLDSYAGLVKGGKSQKPGIVAGNALKSEVFHRVTLPANDDSAMPPSGRTPLTTDEIALLEWWINSGALQQQGVAQIDSDEMQPEVMAIIDNIIAASQEKLLPRKAYTDMELAELTANITSLKQDYGIVVAPVSQDAKDGLSITVFNFHAELDDTAWQHIHQLKDYITSVDFGGMEINDENWQQLASLPHLHTLLLDNANLTSTKLSVLTELPKLKVLNLFNTAVTDLEAAELSKLSGLKSLYLGQTQLSIAGIGQLQSTLKQTKVFHSLVDSAVTQLAEQKRSIEQQKQSEPEKQLDQEKQQKGE